MTKMKLLLHCVTTLIFGGAISVLGLCSRQETVSSMEQHTCNLHFISMCCNLHLRGT